MSNTTTDLINKVKLWSATPDGQPAFTDEQILDIMTDELRTVIAPFIINFREDFYVTSIDYTITNSSNGIFSIPTRAVSTVLKDVVYVDNTNDNIETSVPRIPVGDKDYYSNGFYLKGNKVILSRPSNWSGYTLRIYYYTRPSKLVSVSECAKIASISDTTYIVEGVPGTWTTSESLDATQAESPLGLIDEDNVTAISGTTFTPTTIVDDLAVGDYVSKPTESCIPQIPLEVIPMLVQATVARVNEILHDKSGMKVAMKKYDDLKDSVTSILSPRVVEEPKPIISRNSFITVSTNRWRNH